MNLLQKLTELMENHGDNVASLSRKSGVPYTTIDGLYKKGYGNAKLPTIKAICDVYGVSLDYMIKDEIEDPRFGLEPLSLDDTERQLLAAWRGADESARGIALEILKNHQNKRM